MVYKADNKRSNENDKIVDKDSQIKFDPRKYLNIKKKSQL